MIERAHDTVIKILYKLTDWIFQLANNFIRIIEALFSSKMDKS